MANGSGSVTIQMDTSAVDRLLDNLLEAATEVIRPAAQAGAQIVYDEARRLAGRSTKAHYFYGTSYKKGSESKAGRYLFQPGTLQKAIYQVYSEDNSSETTATYHVSWNMTKAPYGTFVEYGLSPFAKTSKPFLRPAIINKRDEVVVAMEAVVAKRLGNL